MSCRLLLKKKLRVKVATLSQISDLLKKTEQSQRVLEEVTEGFALDVVGEENADETLSIDKLAAADSDIAPVIKLVDTTIFNALERRASDIHIETRDQEVAIKYRIDGVLHYAMPPIAKDWHSTIISRIKVMSELDIAERRVPQDGRFRVRYKSAADRLPRLDHAHDSRRRRRAPRARQRVDEREVLQALVWMWSGFPKRTSRSSAATSRSRTGWCWSPVRPGPARPPRSTPR